MVTMVGYVGIGVGCYRIGRSRERLRHQLMMVTTIRELTYLAAVNQTNEGPARGVFAAILHAEDDVYRSGKSLRQLLSEDR